MYVLVLLQVLKNEFLNFPKFRAERLCTRDFLSHVQGHRNV